MTPETLAEIHAKAFAQTRAWSAKEFAKLLTQNSVIVAGNDRAFALIRVIADEAEILTLATDPAHLRQGLARQVLADAQLQALAKGATTMFLEVAEDNAAARALYDQAGFIQVGHRPNYYSPKNAAPVGALVLQKDLMTR